MLFAIGWINHIYINARVNTPNFYHETPRTPHFSRTTSISTRTHPSSGARATKQGPHITVVQVPHDHVTH